MKALVFGASGLLGSNVAVKAAERGFDVVGTYCTTEPDLEIDCRQCDITDSTYTRQLITECDPDIVINCAAMTDVDACEEKREFRRLKDIDLKSYNFSSIFVDPPRAGLDELTRELVKGFETIIYISCNPETLHRDLEVLNRTHKVENFALFDQFSYTKHIECGVVLTKI